MKNKFDKPREAPVTTSQSAVRATERIRSIIEHLDEIAISIDDIPQIDDLARHYLKQLRQILFSVAEKTATSHLAAPLRAPAKWLERKRRKETPVAFIRREYAPWLTAGNLSRPLIKKLDPSLYAALSNWISANGPLPPDLYLPTKKEMNDRHLEQITNISLKLSPEARERRRLYQLARRRLRSQ